MIRQTVILGVGFLIPFVVGEVVLQTWDPYHFGEKEDWTQYYGKIVDRTDGRLRPEAVASYLGKKTEISSQGWRSPEFEPDKPADVFRILLLGGSVPFGWGVEQGDEFPRVLERMLNRAKLAGQKRIEVINTGVPGWKLPESGKLLLESGKSWRPDIVLLTLVATDVPTERDPGRRGAILNDQIRRLRLARALENRYMFNTPGTTGKPYDAYADLATDGLEWVNAMLHEFDRAARAAGARLVVFDTLGRETTRKRCAALGVHRVDGHTPWAQRRGWEVAVTDAHPNAEGHRFLAELLFQGIQEKSLWEGR